MDSQSCYHCGTPVSGKAHAKAIQGELQLFCCLGCQAAATTIEACGLGDYYRHRAQLQSTPNSAVNTTNKLYEGYDNPDVQSQFVTADEQGLIACYLQVSGISCAACVWLIEQRLDQLPGVTSVALNLSTHRLHIQLDPQTTPLSEVFYALEALGYSAKPWQRTSKNQHLDQLQKDYIVRLGIAGIGMMQIMMNTLASAMGDMASEYTQLLRWASLLLTCPVVFYAALPFYKAAVRDLRTWHFGMDIPVSLALILAFVPSAWATVTASGDTYFESVTMFTFFLLLGRFLEFRALLRLNGTGNGLDDLLPAYTQKWQSGQWVSVASNRLLPGDRILILPGEKLPADGAILVGSSQLNAASFTGEFQPQPVTVGDRVQAGTLNTEGQIEIEVTHSGQQSSLSKMLTLLDQAAAYKPKIAKLADQGASYFVVFVLLLAAMTYGVWLLFDPERAFWVALSVLVVTCPCALSLATPVSLTAAVSALRLSGILPTKSEAFLQLHDVDTLIFDKTGTLTQGQYSIAAVISDDEQHHLAIAAALEQFSSHPIARAFKQGLTEVTADAVVNHPNGGLEGWVSGQQYRLGSPGFCLDAPHSLPDACQQFPDAQWIGLSLVAESRIVAWFGLDDDLRPDAATSLSLIKQRGLKVEMLTGDPSPQGAKIARHLGIDSYKTGLTAVEKMQHIQGLQAAGHRVAMVGDGINDTLALSCAQVAISFEDSATLTQNSADILLLAPQLRLIDTLIGHSERSRRVIQQNLAWGLLYNAIALPFAVSGYVSPLMAAIGMSLSSLLVVLNALRLSRKLS